MASERVFELNHQTRTFYVFHFLKMAKMASSILNCISNPILNCISNPCQSESKKFLSESHLMRLHLCRLHPDSTCRCNLELRCNSDTTSDAISEPRCNPDALWSLPVGAAAQAAASRSPSSLWTRKMRGSSELACLCACTSPK